MATATGEVTETTASSEVLPDQSTSTTAAVTATTAKSTTGGTTYDQQDDCDHGEANVDAARERHRGIVDNPCPDEPQPQPGGTLTYLLFNEITGFDPVGARAAAEATAFAPLPCSIRSCITTPRLGKLIQERLRP